MLEILFSNKENAMVTRRQIIQLSRALNYDYRDAKGDVLKLSTKFNYAILKNGPKLTKMVEEMDKDLIPSSGFISYENERLSLARSLAKKDENGKAVVIKNSNGHEIFDLENKEEGEAQLNELMAKYKESIDERQVQIDAFNALLDTEIEAKIHKISVNDLPDELGMEFIQALSPMLFESEEV
jgi:hypothetical protein